MALPPLGVPNWAWQRRAESGLFGVVTRHSVYTTMGVAVHRLVTATGCPVTPPFYSKV
jgi:hypothetical protein